MEPTRTHSETVRPPRAFRALEWTGVLAWPCAWAPAAWRAVSGGASWAAAAAGALLGWLLSDLISGTFHWAFDTWGSTSTPWLGRTLVRTFREHHVDPRAITRHDFVETNGTNALAAIVLVIASLAFEVERAGGATLAIAMLVASLGVAATSQIHKWAHVERPPRAARWLQRAGLLLRPEHHAEHHAPPHVRAYCITCGWLDPVLEALRLMPALERAITRLTGARPRASDRRPRR